MSATPVPSEFEFELRSERSRWLRRRLLWLCATGTLLTLILDGPDVVNHLANPESHHRHAGIVIVLECLAITALYSTAFVYACIVRVRERSLLQLVFWLLVSVAAVELLSRRLIDNILLAPQVSPNPLLSPAGFSAFIGMVLLGFDHFIACLLMPWTVREALRPAGVMLALFATSVLWDISRGQLDGTGMLTIPMLAVSFIPGIIICWWRSSRFKRFFQLRFESTRYRLLQGELAAARRLLDATLPEQRGDGPLRLHYAYEPMRQIGGDLLFVNPTSPDAKLISAVLLDVTGHGIAAALTVNRLIGELDRLFAESPGALPRDILLSLNRYFGLTLARHNIYATALCLRLNSETGELQWANGGHPPAIIRRADGRLESIDSNASLLGVFEADEFFTPAPALPVTLHPGDVLLAYTDGLSEAANPDGVQLGTQGIKELITNHCSNGHPSDAWPRMLLDATLAFRQSPVEDDTLVIALFRAPAPENVMK